eukprot:11167087-Lingulodinium_polyedra.AAC.1
MRFFGVRQVDAWPSRASFPARGQRRPQRVAKSSLSGANVRCKIGLGVAFVGRLFGVGEQPNASAIR